MKRVVLMLKALIAFFVPGAFVDRLRLLRARVPKAMIFVASAALSAIIVAWLGS